MDIADPKLALAVPSVCLGGRLETVRIDIQYEM